MMHVKFVISQGLQFVTCVAVAPMLYKNDRDEHHRRKVKHTDR